MTAGQAMQQVRATSDPLTVASTDDRKDLVGHGLVNALKAVSDTNAHAVRIEGFTIADDFGHGEFLPGESGGIVVKAVNYLKPVRNLLARVEVFQGGDAIDLRSSIVPFGQAQMLDTLRNIQAAFRIHVHDTVPQNTTVIFKLTFFDTIVGYGPDVDYFSFVINPTYLDLNASNIIATFSSKGTIGFNDVVTNRDGTGFIWQKAPASIESFGKSLLFQGGIMIGTNATQVVDVVQDQGAFAGDEDLAPGDVVHYVSPVDHFNAIQELACRYSDSIADLSVHVGVNVTQRAYEFNTGLGSNAIIVNYVFRKTGGSQLTDSSAVALFTDWDVGLSGALNIARFDSASQTAITYRVESGYPFAGMKIISPLPAGASVQYHAIRNNGSEGGINTYNGFSKQAKWRAMTEWYPQTGPADVSHTLGLKNVPMASQDSIVMTVVFALAEDPEVLKRTIDVATVLWDAPLGVTPSAHTAGLPSLHVYPDPFRSTLHLNWNVPSSGTAHVALLDVLGRTVMSGDFEGTVCDLSSLHLSPGPYVAQVLVGDRRMSVPVVCTR
jgi:hypothetical protein